MRTNLSEISVSKLGSHLTQKIRQNEAYQCLKRIIRMFKDEEMGKNERNNVPEMSRVEI